MPILHTLQRLDNGLASLERMLAMALTAAIALIMMAQVILRYFFNAPLFWAEEVAAQLLVFLTLVGTSLLLQNQQLVNIDFLPRALSQRNQLFLFALLGVGMLILVLFLTKLGWEWIQRPDVRLEMGATTQLPRWYNYSVLPIVFACMAFHQLIIIAKHIQQAFQKES